jgi:hypothetical protein
MNLLDWHAYEKTPMQPPPNPLMSYLFFHFFHVNPVGGTHTQGLFRKINMYRVFNIETKKEEAKHPVSHSVHFAVRAQQVSRHDQQAMTTKQHHVLITLQHHQQ